MRKLLLITSVVLMATVAQAAVIATPDVITAAPGEIVVIPVNITGGEQLQAAQFTCYIGDGGEMLGGVDTVPPAPAITAVDIIHGIFAASNTGQGDFGYAPLPAILASATTTTVGTAFVAAQGLLATITIQANAPGDWALAFYPDDCKVGGTAAIPYTFTGGMIHVTPEPAALALLAIGGLFLRRRMA